MSNRKLVSLTTTWKLIIMCLVGGNWTHFGKNSNKHGEGEDDTRLGFACAD